LVVKELGPGKWVSGDTLGHLRDGGSGDPGFMLRGARCAVVELLKIRNSFGLDCLRSSDYPVRFQIGVGSDG